MDGVATVPVMDTFHAPVPSVPAEKTTPLPFTQPEVAVVPSTFVLQKESFVQLPPLFPEPAVTPLVSQYRVVCAGRSCAATTHRSAVSQSEVGRSVKRP